MAATQRLTAYGVTAKGSGYADADDACEEASSGTQLLATDNSAVYVYAEAGEADERIYLVKIATPTIAAHFYVQGDGYAAGQKVYVPEQAIGGIFGTITTAGWYTVAIDRDFATAVYITTFDDADEMTQPTACPEDPWTAESTPTEPQYSADFTINKYDNMSVQYKRQVEQIPFSKGSNTPANLRKRSSAYKVTKG